MEVFVESHLKLLEIERQEEVNSSHALLTASPKVLESKGVCLQRMRLNGIRTGLYGKTVAEFELAPNRDLPANTFSSGDLVGIYPEKAQTAGDTAPFVSAVLLKMAPRGAALVLDEATEGEGLHEDHLYRLVKLGSDVTYKRIKKGLQQLLASATGGPSSRIVDILFGSDPPAPTPPPPDLKFFNEGLDDSQKAAVAFALSRPDVAIIHGPPGTGKTTTLVELVRQATRGRKLRLLACAPSNVAVDNMLERLASAKPPLRLVRLGHAARVLPHLQRHSLDAQLAASDAWSVLQDVRREMDATRKSLGRPQGAAKFRLRAQLADLRRELRAREAKALQEIFARADVVLATLTGLHSDRTLRAANFDLALIDECSQAVEAACWLALLRAPRCVIAGDHLQLPPTVMSKEAAQGGLELSLMERLLRLYPGEEVTRLLSTQYRMHEHIMAWSGAQFYEGKLVAHPSVARHGLQDLQHVRCEEEEAGAPIVLVDTAGCGLTETQLEVSRGNPGEADLVLILARQLREMGVREEEIGVITPYNLQVEFIRNRVKPQLPKIEVKTVDGFQGREKEVIILSLVRSNEAGEVGFLSEYRRLNVAVTRARRQLVVVCDTDTLSRGRDDVINSFVEHLRSTAGCVRSAQEFIDACDMEIGAIRPEDVAKLEDSAGAAAVGQKKAKAKSAKNKKQKEGERGEAKKPPEKSAKTAEPKPPLPVEEFSADVQAFALSTETEKAFPDTLTPFQRAAIHELAEKLSLIHVSVGEGKSRHLVLRKPASQSAHAAAGSKSPDIAAAKPPDTAAAKPPDIATVKSPDIAAAKSPDTVAATSPDIAAAKSPDIAASKSPDTAAARPPDIAASTESSLPDDPILRQLRLYQEEQRARRLAEQSGYAAAPKIRTKARQARHKTKGRLGPAEEAEEDFDALLAAAAAADNRCGFEGCKTPVRTVGRVCALCSARFCLQHALPEAHGCGSAARVQARRVLSREGRLHAGSGVPSKLPDPTRRSHLERRMDKKLDELADQRRPKKKEKKG